MNRWFGATIGAMLLLTVQACQTPQPGSTSDDRAAATTGTVAPISSAAPKEPKDSSKQAVAPPSTPLLSAEDRDPRRLLRMNRQSLATLLGKPQFVRREADARVWQYRSEACVLDLFLYGVATAHEVIHYEFRPATTLSGPTPGCFEALLTRTGNVASS